MSQIPDYLIAASLLDDTDYAVSLLVTRGFGTWGNIYRIPLRGYLGYSQVVDKTFTASPESRTWTPLDLASRTWVAS